MKKETKRKSIIALGALALILAVGATAGTTFAKYSSSKTVETSPTATVAKWGFVINANTDNLFGDKYGNVNAKDLATKTTAAATDSSVVVAASTANSNIVAPGTSGYFTITISGIAEVDAEVTASVATNAKFDGVWLEAKDASVKDYHPINWTVSVDDVVQGKKSNNSNDVVDAINNLKVRYDAGQSAGFANTTKTSTVIKVAWEWPFTTGESDDEKAKNDELDTILGIYANYPNGILPDNAVVSDSQKTAMAKYTAHTTLTIPAITVKVEQVNK